MTKIENNCPYCDKVLDLYQELCCDKCWRDHKSDFKNGTLYDNWLNHNVYKYIKEWKPTSYKPFIISLKPRELD